MAKKLLPMIIALLLGSLFLFSNCDDDHDHNHNGAITIYDLVEESKDHKILFEAIKAAGLENALKSESLSLTLFAPTDAAFEELPEEDLASLLEDPINLLKPILLYHVVNSKVTSADLSNGLVIEMADGLNSTITIDGSIVMINTAEITAPDLYAENGVLHVIDKVMLPPTNSVADEVASNESLMTLSTALTATGLDGTLSDDNKSFTLFAPTNEAFELLPDGAVADLLSQPELLSDILLYHALSNDVYSSQLSNSMVKTINGADVAIKLEGGNVYVNDAQVEVADIICKNGVIHIISKVLTPPTE